MLYAPTWPAPRLSPGFPGLFFWRIPFRNKQFRMLRFGFSRCKLGLPYISLNIGPHNTMMILKRGRSIVLGLTDENMDSLVHGRVLRVMGEAIEEPGLTVYIVTSESNDSFREELRANGYPIDEHPDYTGECCADGSGSCGGGGGGE